MSSRSQEPPSAVAYLVLECLGREACPYEQQAQQRLEGRFRAGIGQRNSGAKPPRPARRAGLGLPAETEGTIEQADEIRGECAPELCGGPLQIGSGDLADHHGLTGPHPVVKADSVTSVVRPACCEQ
jgi:hypothetical protein